MLRLHAFDRCITIPDDTAAEDFARHGMITLQGRASAALLPGQIEIDHDPETGISRVCLLQPKTANPRYMPEFRRAPRQAIATELLLFAQAAYKPDKPLIETLQKWTAEHHEIKAFWL